MSIIQQVHAIFGAFLAGIIVPREGGLAIALTEKLEDMVSIIFLPLVSFDFQVIAASLAHIDHSTLRYPVYPLTWVFSTTVGVVICICQVSLHADAKC